jgi:ATP-dependent DNA ligase
VPGERSDDWQKLKLENQKEFVIGGYRPGFERHRCAPSRYYDENGLRFAGKVRAGFVPHLRREVFKALKPHHVDDCPSPTCLLSMGRPLGCGRRNEGLRVRDFPSAPVDLQDN